MPQFHTTQISPPKTWQEFEELCADLWQEIFGSTNTELNGRAGQPQHGVDVYGQIGNSTMWYGVQCKGKDNRFYEDNTVTEEELRAEVKKAESFKPQISRFILATTAPNDAKIQEIARKLTVENQGKGLFTVQVKSWDEIHREISKYKIVMEKYYPSFSDFSELILQKISHLTSAFDGAAQLPNSKLDDAISKQIDVYRDLLNSGEPKTALNLLEQLKCNSWGELSRYNKFRVTTNIAASHQELGNDSEASRHFIDAHEIEPNDEKGLCNLVVAYHLLGDEKAASDAAEIAVNTFPKSPMANRLKVASTKFTQDDTPENTVPKELHHLSEICFAIGQAYLLTNRLDEAVVWLKRGYDNSNDDIPEVKAAYASALLQQLYNKKHITLGRQLSNEDADQLSFINSIFLELWNRIRRKEYIGTDSIVINNLLFTKFLMGDIEEGLDIVNVVLSKPKLDAVLVKQIAYQFMDAKQYDNAVELVKKYYEEEPIKWALIYTETLARCRNFKNALEVIQGYLEQKKDPIGLGVELKLLGFTNSESLDIKANSSLEQYPESVSLHVDVSNAYAKSKQIEEAKKYAIQAASLLSEESSYFDKLSVADNFFDLEMFEESIPLYESLVVEYVDSYQLRNLIKCYYSCDYRRKLVSLFERISADTRKENFYRQYASVTYEISGLYNQALTELELYLKNEPCDLRETLHWFGLCQRLNQEDKIVEHLKSHIDYQSANSADFIYLANFYCQYSSFARGIELAVDTTLENFENADVNMAYVQLFMSRASESTEHLEVDIVQENTYVSLKDERRNQLNYFISKCNIVSPDSISLEHPISQECIGKKVGDSIEVQSTPYSSIVYKISSLTSLPVFLYRRILDSFSIRFPNYDKPFWKLDVQGSDGEEFDFSEFFKMIDAHQEHTSKVLADYKTKPYPICLVAELLGKPQLDVWVGMQSDKSEKIYNCIGTSEERETATCILKQKNTYIIDPLTLHNMFTLKVENVVKDSLEQLAVTQSCIDFYNCLIGEARLEINKRKGIVSKTDDGYISHEINPNEATEAVELYKSIVEWTKNNCLIAPAIENETPTEGMKRLSKALSREFYDTLIAAEGNGYYLFTEDLRFRLLAKVACGAEGVWLQAVLMKAVELGVMGNDEYACVIAELTQRGLNFTSVGQESLLAVAKQNNWQVTDSLESMLSTLGEEGADFSASIAVAVTFMHDSIFSDNFECIVYATLNGVTRNYCRSGSENILIKLIQASDYFYKYYGDKAAIIYLNAIYNWCRGHFVSATFFETQ